MRQQVPHFVSLTYNNVTYYYLNRLRAPPSSPEGDTKLQQSDFFPEIFGTYGKTPYICSLEHIKRHGNRIM